MLAEEENENGNGGEEQDTEDEGQSMLTDESDADDNADVAAKQQGNDGQQEAEANNDDQQIELVPVLLLEPQPDDDQQQQLAYELADSTEKANNNNKTEAKRSQPSADEQTESAKLEAAEQTQLDQLLHKMLLNRRAGTEAAGALNERQLSRLVQFVRQLQTLLMDNVIQRAEEAEQRLKKAVEAANEEEAADEEQLVAKSEGPVLLLKKDSEQFNNADMGLANTVHKIVKGGIQRVEGNRVYLRVAKDNLTEEELYKLIAYLDRKIAAPNRLYFDQFLYEDGQLSFRISRPPSSGTKQMPHLESASGVAQAVYKRRKDIQVGIVLGLFLLIHAISADSGRSAC